MSDRTSVSPPKFLIAVFGQPISSFEKWKRRGINTLVSHEPEGGRVSKRQWEDAAAAAGLFFMDYPGPTDEEMRFEAQQQPHRLAWMQNDEPDLNRWHADRPADDPANAWLIPEGRYFGWTQPAILQERYRRCKAIAPALPIFVNFAGPQITPEAYTHGQGHQPYIDAADWLAHDWYVKNKNFARYPIDLIAQAMQRLAAWSGGKPQFAFIECSAQGISSLGRSPTPDELEAEIDLAAANGARGIVYFPQRIGPSFGYDAVTPEMEQRITAINARLAAADSQPDPGVPAQPTLGDIVQRLDLLINRLEIVTQEIAFFRQNALRASFDLKWESTPASR